MSGLDAIALAADEPREIELVSPITGQVIRDKDGRAATVTVVSGDSEAARAHERKVGQRMLDRGRRGKTRVEEMEASGVELLVAVTRGWYLLTFEGEVIDHPFSESNARALYADRRFAWLRAQVDEGVADRAAFLSGSSKS